MARTAFFLFLFLSLFSLSAQPAESPAKPHEALSALEFRTGSHFGVGALDTDSGQHLEHRADERFLLCSTFKFLAAAAVLHRVDQEQDRLNRFVPYTAADLLEYAPVTKEHVQQGGMTLGALCAAAITMSDNTAANLLLESIGGPAGLTRYARSLGDNKTRLDRMEPDLNSASPGDVRDTTTPAAMLNDMRTILLGDALSAESRRLLENWMHDNKTGAGMIRAGVPSNWKVGDKTGRNGNGTINDIAIIRPPNRAPILLAIYSTGSNLSSETGTAAIAEAARLVVTSFAAKNQSPETSKQKARSF